MVCVHMLTIGYGLLILEDGPCEPRTASRKQWYDRSSPEDSLGRQRYCLRRPIDVLWRPEGGQWNIEETQKDAKNAKLHLNLQYSITAEFCTFVNFLHS